MKPARRLKDMRPKYNPRVTTTPSGFAIAERTATLFALIQLFGATVFRLTVVTPMLSDGASTREPGTFAYRLDSLTKSAAAIAALFLVVLAGVRLHMQVVALFDGWNNVGTSELSALLLHSVWGQAWLLQVAASAIVGAGPFIGRPLDAWMTIPLALSAALTGHAVANGLAPVTIGMTAVHVVAAGGWAGGVLFVLVASVLCTSPHDLLRVVRGFNAVALTCAATAAATGVFAAYRHVGSLSALFASTYGTQLLVKVAFVGMTAAVGAWNWRRGVPALARGNHRPIHRAVIFETLLSVAIVVATARLVLLAPPAMEP
jgi:putative copper export protein